MGSSHSHAKSTWLGYSKAMDSSLSTSKRNFVQPWCRRRWQLSAKLKPTTQRLTRDLVLTEAS